MVERVCDCDLETEEVQLQVIKALVHACTATTLAVHQASLLTAVKTIYTVRKTKAGSRNGCVQSRKSPSASLLQRSVAVASPVAFPPRGAGGALVIFAFFSDFGYLSVCNTVFF